MSEFLSKLNELEFDFVFDEKIMENTWMKQSYSWFMYYSIMTWIFTFLKYYIWYYMKIGYISLLFADWLAFNIMKDMHLVLFLLFVLNFFFVIMQFHMNETKKNWFDFNSNMKSYEEIPYEVKQTWMYKYMYIYMSNFNMFLWFFCLVESDHIFVQVFLPLSDGMLMLVICSIMHVIFWMNYFFVYSKSEMK